MQPKRANRLYADISVDVRLPVGEHKKPGRVRNLTADGLLVEYENPLRAGQSIGLEFPPSRERGRMVVLGEVAWSDDKRAGVRVCGMMPHHRARFERLLGNLQSGKNSVC
jgi:hypothetical protein